MANRTLTQILVTLETDKRQYFPTQQAAEAHLVKHGYNFNPDPSELMPWWKNRTVAEVRYNSQGYFINTRLISRSFQPRG